MIVERGKWLDRTAGRLLHALLVVLEPLFRGGRRRPPGGRSRALLAIKLWGVGNVALILPLLEDLRRAHPGARILFLTLEGNGALAALSPAVDEVLVLRMPSIRAFVLDGVRLVLRLLRARVDTVVDFEQFCRVSGLAAWASGAAVRIGFRTAGTGRAAAYSHTVTYTENDHMAGIFRRLAAEAGAPPRGSRPLLPAPGAGAEAEVDALLSAFGEVPSILAVVHPGSGDNFTPRRWPVERFAAVGRDLVMRYGARVVVTGGASESELVRRLVALLPAGSGLDASSRLSLPGLMALLRRATLLVSSDTGPVHLASGLGVPVFAVYGPNTPDLYGPLCDEGWAFHRRLPCSPCLSNLNGKSSACRFAVCLRAIRAEDVSRVIALRIGTAHTVAAAVP